jgi:predicted ATPase
MIRRIYIHNFRCLENFELRLGDMPSALLIGRNGAGKTSIGMAIEVFQKIARGVSRVNDLVREKDLTRGRAEIPARFEIEVGLAGKVYVYALAMELPDGFRELRVVEEKLSIDGRVLFAREAAQVRISRLNSESAVTFGIDWHVVALPIVQHISANDPIAVFKDWLSNIIVLRPSPNAMRGNSDYPQLQPDPQVGNLGDWFSGLLLSSPSVFVRMVDYLKSVMPDFQDIKNYEVGRNIRSMSVQFGNEKSRAEFSLEELSDGEKCFLVGALAIAANDVCGPLLCFWDEPENFLSPSEVGATVMALRRAFRKRGQLIITSHHPEAVSRFSDENTILISRSSHLEPVIARTVQDIRSQGGFEGSFVNALTRGDLFA